MLSCIQGWLRSREAPLLVLTHASVAAFDALSRAMRFQARQAFLEKLPPLCLFTLMATRCYSLLSLNVVCFPRVCCPLRQCLRC